MFSKSNIKQKKSSAEKKSEAKEKKFAVPSLISADLSITGDLISDGEVQIDGKVEGDVRCRELLVGIDGCIIGGVRADKVSIHGSITGQVLAKAVFLASTARMTGDVTHESLAIEPGAFVEGLCRHMSAPIPAEQAKSDLMLTDERFSKVSKLNVDKKDEVSEDKIKVNSK